MTRLQRPRVLILAEAANPEMVSVPLVGWSLAEALRKVADIHLVTQVRNREAILRAGWVEGKDFTVVDSERVARPLWRLTKLFRVGGASNKGWTVAQAISVVSDAYHERLVWKEFGPRIQAKEWDVVHRITPLSPIKPSLVGRRAAASGVPFVMGPLNGGVPWPKGFESVRRKERELLSKLRSFVRIIPNRISTWKAASAILVGSKHTAGEIPPYLKGKLIYIPENGISDIFFRSNGSNEKISEPLRACFVGRMVPLKGADLLIEAAAPILRSGKLRLDMIGDGPMLNLLKEKAKEKNIDDCITFYGWLSHREVARVMQKSDFLAFPSIREFGGGVVLEAMASGLPPLVVDYAGPGELVSEAWGFKVPIGSPACVVDGLREALIKIVDDPECLESKRSAGREIIAERFLWSRKADQVLEVYNWVLNKSEDKPGGWFV